MKTLCISLLFLGSIAASKGESPENQVKSFIKAELEQMLNGQSVALLDAADTSSDIYLTHNYRVVSIKPTLRSEGDQYYKAVVVFDTSSYLSRDGDEKSSDWIRKQGKIQVEVFLKKSGSQLSWTRPLDTVFVRHGREHLFMSKALADDSLPPE